MFCVGTASSCEPDRTLMPDPSSFGRPQWVVEPSRAASMAVWLYPPLRTFEGNEPRLFMYVRYDNQTLGILW